MDAKFYNQVVVLRHNLNNSRRIITPTTGLCFIESTAIAAIISKRNAKDLNTDFHLPTEGINSLFSHFQREQIRKDLTVKKSHV